MNKADEVIDTLLTKMKSHNLSWDKAFTSLANAQKNKLTGKNYRGSNQWILAMTSAMEGYTSGQWLTFNQCKELDGQVKKGEKATAIVFWSMIPDKKDEKGNVIKEGFGFWKVYHVFALEQTTLPIEQPQPLKNRSNVEAFISGMILEHASSVDCAYYSKNLDKVYMPFQYQWKNPESYLSTLFHESIHWTGHESRLSRQELANYATMRAEEEVIAELGASLLCAQNGIFHAVDQNNAAYIKHWLDKAESKDLRDYLSKAQKAADYVQERLKLFIPGALAA